MTRVSLEPAYILHRRAYRETSLLVESFTAEHGRVGLVARGARRGRSPMAALLQPFQPLLLSWSGAGELSALTGAEGLQPFVHLTGERLMSGFYLNELLMRLLHRNDPQPALFELYGRTLERLGGDEGSEWALRMFEKQLLDELGYGLLLEREADTGEGIQAGRRYCYHLEVGPLARGEGGILVQGETLLALAAGTSPAGEGLAEAKRLMRAALGLYLGDRPLKSRELFLSLYRKEPK